MEINKIGNNFFQMSQSEIKTLQNANNTTTKNTDIEATPDEEVVLADALSVDNVEQTEKAEDVSSIKNVDAIDSTTSVSKNNTSNTSNTKDWTIDDYADAAIAKLEKLIDFASESNSSLSVANGEVSANLEEYLDLDGDGKISYNDYLGLLVARDKILGSDYADKLAEYDKQLAEKTSMIEERYLEKYEKLSNTSDKDLLGENSVVTGNRDIAIMQYRQSLKEQIATQEAEELETAQKQCQGILGDERKIAAFFDSCMSNAKKAAAKNYYDLDEISSFLSISESIDTKAISATMTSTGSDSAASKIKSIYSDMVKNLNVNKIVADDNWEEKFDDISGLTDTQKKQLQKASEYVKNNSDTKEYAGLYAIGSSSGYNCYDINQDGVINFEDLNSLPDEFDFDSDGTISDSEKSRLKTLKSNLYNKLKSELSSNIGTIEKQSSTKSTSVNTDSGSVSVSRPTTAAGNIGQNNTCKLNWDIQDLIGLLEYENNNALSTNASEKIISKLVDSLTSAFDVDVDFQSLINAIDNCDNETVKERLADVRAKAQEQLELTKQTVAPTTGDLDTMLETNGLQIITNSSAIASEMSKEYGDVISVNKYDDDYDFYKKLTGECTKAIKIYGYSSWLEIIQDDSGAIDTRYAFGIPPEDSGMTLEEWEEQCLKQWLGDNYEEILDAIKNGDKSLEDLAAQANTEVIYGPQITAGGDQYKSLSASASNASQIYLVYNGKVLYSTPTSTINTRDNLHFWDNVSTDSLKEIVDYYLEKLNLSDEEDEDKE